MMRTSVLRRRGVLTSWRTVPGGSGSQPAGRRRPTSVSVTECPSAIRTRFGARSRGRAVVDQVAFLDKNLKRATVAWANLPKRARNAGLPWPHRSTLSQYTRPGVGGSLRLTGEGSPWGGGPARCRMWSRRLTCWRHRPPVWKASVRRSARPVRTRRPRQPVCWPPPRTRCRRRSQNCSAPMGRPIND